MTAEPSGLLSLISLLPKLLPAFLARAIAALGSVSLVFYISRQLGAEALGAFSLAQATVLLLVLFGRWGYPRLLTRLVASSDSTNTGVADQLAYVLRTVLRNSIVLALLCSGTATVLLWVGFHSGPVGSLAIMGLAIVPLALCWVLSGLAKGRFRAARGLLMENGTTALLTVVILAGIGVWLPVSLAQTSAIYVVAAWVMVGVSIALNREDFVLAGGRFRRLDRRALQRQMQPAASSFFLVDLSNFLLGAGSFVLAGAFLSLEAVGTLRAAERLAVLLALILNVTNVFFAPRISRAFSEGQVGQVARLGRRAILINAALGAILFLPLFVWSSGVLSLFSQEFGKAAWLLQIMLTGQYFNLLTGPVGNTLAMTGNEEILRKINIAMLMLGCLAFPLFSWLWGGVVFAFSYSAVLILKNILLVYFVWRRLGLLFFFQTRAMPDAGRQI